VRAKLARMKAIGGTAAALALGCLAAGCSTMRTPEALKEPPVAASPVAEQVLRASREPGPYPKWTDIPAMPRDVRPASAWAGAVQAVKADASQLQAEVAADPPTLFDTEAWAAEQVQAAQAPPQITTTTTEEFLANTRIQAAPPPPPR